MRSRAMLQIGVLLTAGLAAGLILDDQFVDGRNYRILQTNGMEIRGSVTDRGDAYEVQYATGITIRVSKTHVARILPMEAEHAKDQESVSKEESAASAPTERQKLLTAISGEYVGGRSAPSFRVRIKRLQELMVSEDPQIQEVTKLALGLNTLYALINKQADLSAEGRLFMAQILGYALTSDGGPTDSLREAANVVNAKGGAIDLGIERVRGIMDRGDEIQKAQNSLRNAVKRMVRGPALPSFDPQEDFSIAFKPGKPGEQLRPSSQGYLSLTNRTGKPLQAVTCVVDVRTNDRKVDAAIAAEKQRWLIPSAISEGLGVDPELQKRNLENVLRYYERLRLGYGMMIHVPTIRPGATVKFEFASLGDIDHVVDAVEVLIVSEGVGACTTTVDVESMRKETERVVRAQMNKGKRKP